MLLAFSPQGFDLLPQCLAGRVYAVRCQVSAHHPGQLSHPCQVVTWERGTQRGTPYTCSHTRCGAIVGPQGRGCKGHGPTFFSAVAGECAHCAYTPPPCQIKKMRAAGDWCQRTWTKDGPSFRLMPSRVRAFVQTRLASTPRQCGGQVPRIRVYVSTGLSWPRFR
jgi:hypothetical protein